MQPQHIQAFWQGAQIDRGRQINHRVRGQYDLTHRIQHGQIRRFNRQFIEPHRQYAVGRVREHRHRLQGRLVGTGANHHVDRHIIRSRTAGRVGDCDGVRTARAHRYGWRGGGVRPIIGSAGIARVEREYNAFADRGIRAEVDQWRGNQAHRGDDDAVAAILVSQRLSKHTGLVGVAGGGRQQGRVGRQQAHR